MPFEAVRETIGSIFSKIGAMDQVIACLDGLTSLLRDRGFTDHRAILRSHLVRTRCRIIGILSSHEYEEQIAIDPELNELFSIVRLDEPQPETACKLVRH